MQPFAKPAQRRQMQLVLVVQLLLLPNVAQAGGIHLAWGQNQEASGYNVYRSATSGGPYVRLNQAPVTSLFYLDESADLGQTYYYVVTAIYSSGGESGYSQELPVPTGRYDLTANAESSSARNLPYLSAAGGQLVVLSGEGWDPEGRNLTFSWNQVLGPTVPIIGQNRPEASFVAPQVTQDTFFVFKLTVARSDGTTATDSIQVTVRKK